MKFLKVPKHENFSLAFFALREPIWVGDLGNDPKKTFFFLWPMISMVFGFLPHTECAVNKNKVWSKAKIKSWWWLLLSPYVCLQCVFRKILKFWFFNECLKTPRRIIFCTPYSVPSNRVISSLDGKFGTVGETFVLVLEGLFIKISNLYKNHLWMV
jgi:hypothetical protein